MSFVEPLLCQCAACFFSCFLCCFEAMVGEEGEFSVVLFALVCVHVNNTMYLFICS